MERRMLSIIVILCTAVCVSIMVFADKIDTKENKYKDKIEVINNNTSKQNTSIKKDISQTDNKVESKVKPETSYTVTDAYKNLKMNEMNEKMEQDKENIKKDSSENTINEKVKENLDGSSNNSAPVFKVTKSQIKDKLTLSDKEKLLSIAAKLSAVDYEKINKYLQNGSDEDIKSTIKLLKSRLSDKDYEKVKVVAEKFINMDVVEK